MFSFRSTFFLIFLVLVCSTGLAQPPMPPPDPPVQVAILPTWHIIKYDLMNSHSDDEEYLLVDFAVDNWNDYPSGCTWELWVTAKTGPSIWPTYTTKMVYAVTPTALGQMRTLFYGHNAGTEVPPEDCWFHNGGTFEWEIHVVPPTTPPAGKTTPPPSIAGNLYELFDTYTQLDERLYALEPPNGLLGDASLALWSTSSVMDSWVMTVVPPAIPVWGYVPPLSDKIKCEASYKNFASDPWTPYGSVITVGSYPHNKYLKYSVDLAHAHRYYRLWYFTEITISIPGDPDPQVIRNPIPVKVSYWEYYSFGGTWVVRPLEGPPPVNPDPDPSP